MCGSEAGGVDVFALSLSDSTFDNDDGGSGDDDDDGRGSRQTGSQSRCTKVVVEVWIQYKRLVRLLIPLGSPLSPHYGAAQYKWVAKIV